MSVSATDERLRWIWPLTFVVAGAGAANAIWLLRSATVVGFDGIAILGIAQSRDDTIWSITLACAVAVTILLVVAKSISVKCPGGWIARLWLLAVVAGVCCLLLERQVLQVSYDPEYPLGWKTTTLR